MDRGAWKAAVHGVAEGWTRLSNFTFTFHFHALEKKMATHSNVLAWRIPGTVEPGGLPSMGSHRVRHNWSDLVVVGKTGYTWRGEDLERGMLAKEEWPERGVLPLSPAAACQAHLKSTRRWLWKVHASLPGATRELCPLERLPWDRQTPKGNHEWLTD